jgi:hypothetical protein
MNFNHDITFCTSINCPYRFNCMRNIINNKFEKGELISQCNFEHTYSNCNYFIKK